MGESRKSGGFGGGKSRGFRPGGDRPSFARKGGFGGSRDRDDSRSTQMFSAMCSDCGKNCEVPFRPSADRSVFCKDCFGAKRDGQGGDRGYRATPRSFEDRDTSFSAAPKPQAEDKRIDELKRQLDVANKKLDTIMEMVEEMVVAKGDEIRQAALAKAVKSVTKKTAAKK